VRTLLLVTPPMVQLNTAYPAVPALAAFLQHHGYRVVQADLLLELALRLFSPAGVREVGRALRRCFTPRRGPQAIRHFLAHQLRIEAARPKVVALLQGTPMDALTLEDFEDLPQGSRFASMQGLWTDGEPTGRARHHASLFLDEIADAVREGLDPRFEPARYAEHLASAGDYPALAKALQRRPRLMDRWIDQQALPACGGGGKGQDAATLDARAPTEPGACPPVATRSGPFTRLTVGNAPSGMGINDPSVEHLPAQNLWLMAYTAVVPSPLYQHISLASANDNGSTWSYLGDVTLASSNITITTTNLSICGKATCTGTSGQESPALLFDEFDRDPNRRFKVFAHAYYFDLIGDRQMDIGYLALYTAKDPTGPWTETRLFGWPSSSSLSNQGVVYDISRDRALGLDDCVIVGEPAPLLRAPGTIDLALSCPKGTTDIRLLRSLDHGKTWSFVSTLLTAEDGPKLGSQTKDITGGDLFYANDAYHLIVSPFGTIQGPGGETFSGYHGCLVVAVADMDQGPVARCNGSPSSRPATWASPVSSWARARPPKDSRAVAC
jgi:hypothetical protein